MAAGGVRYLVEARRPRRRLRAGPQAASGPLGGGLSPELGVALLAGFAVAVVVGARGRALLARPLRRTAAAARCCAAGAATSASRSPGPAEIADVADALNELAAALATSEDRQRQFLLSVSHELRTPLTAIRGFAESLADGVISGETSADAGRVIVREAHGSTGWSATCSNWPGWTPTTSGSTSCRVDLAALLATRPAVWRARCAAAGVPWSAHGRRPAACASTRAGSARSSTAWPRTPCASSRRAPRWCSRPAATPTRRVVAGARRRPGAGPGGLRSSSSAVPSTTGTADVRPVGSGGFGLALVHGLVTRIGGTSARAGARGRRLLHRVVPGPPPPPLTPR